MTEGEGPGKRTSFRIGCVTCIGVSPREGVVHPLPTGPLGGEATFQGLGPSGVAQKLREAVREKLGRINSLSR